MSAAQTDLYDLLGVSASASQAELKRAFRKKAKDLHPDRNSAPDAETKFKQVNAAYDVLSDPDKRQRYDRHGMAGVNGGQGGGHGFAGFEDGNGFGDIFDAFFRGTSTRRAGPQRGADLRTTVTLTFEEAVFGATRDLEYDRVQTCQACSGGGSKPGSRPGVCSDCDGHGEVRRAQQSLFGQFVNVVTCQRCEGSGEIVTDPCVECRGRGAYRQGAKHTIEIPAGIDDDSQIRVNGGGDAGRLGGPAGHLFLEIQVQPHEHFLRADHDLIYDLPLNVAQAALGAEVEVPTIDGEPASLQVKPGTQHGTVLTVRGKGVPHLRGSGRGDLKVRLHVVTPSDLTEEQRELLGGLADSLGTPVLPADSSLFGRIRDAFS